MGEISYILVSKRGIWKEIPLSYVEKYGKTTFTQGTTCFFSYPGAFFFPIFQKGGGADLTRILTLVIVIPKSMLEYALIEDIFQPSSSLTIQPSLSI